jgi:hypothetical protein
VARQIAEWLKSGSSVGIPSTYYPSDMGGQPKWEIEIPATVLDVEGLVHWIIHLWDQISYGIGVPPELLRASESGGSGYSARKIPQEAFLMRQQRIADALLQLFVDQVLKPLVRWNFGPEMKFQATIKNLLMTYRLAQGGQEGSQQQEGAPGQTPGSAITQSGQPQQPQQGPEPMLQTPQQGRFSVAMETRDKIVMDVVRRILARAA